MTTTHTRERTLQDDIAPKVEEALSGVEVLAVELVSPSRFCVYVDHPDGVDHELCARVTRLLDDYRAEFTIDVSSPGPERPLRKPEHFAAARGRSVSVRTGTPVAGRTRFKGEVADAADRALTLSTPTADVHIPYEDIVRANLIDEGLTT